jgi:hypothetical protein
MSAAPKLSDHEFVVALRAAIEQYFTAVDGWEAAYQKYYRMPGTVTISPDVAAEQREYDERRRQLQELLPRARRLCLKHQLQEPFSGLLRVSLGRYAPQARMDSAIGRSERGVVTKCLAQLGDACREWPDDGAESGSPRPWRALLRRLVNFFY